MSDSAPSTQGTRRLLNGRYELERLLGRGGMADVFLGKDLRLGRPVAVKLLRPDLARDPQFQARFRREAQAVAGLNHPSIVAVYDTADEPPADGRVDSPRLPYIVMEYVQGHTLRELVRSGTLSIDHAIDYSLGVLSALEYSHRAGIVHRDIKPANVMVTADGGSVKVMDFGIARAMADSSATMTQTQAVIGTAQYLSPEQARGESVDARSDLYSAACLLYEMLTGRPPFVGDSPVSVAYQHVGEAAELPSHYNPQVSPALDSVLVKALQKDRLDRFQDAAAFRRALRAAKAGVALPVPVVAPDPVAAPAETVAVAAVEAPAPVPGTSSDAVAPDAGPSTRAMAKVLSGGSLTTGEPDEAEEVPLGLMNEKEVDRRVRRRRRAWITVLFIGLLIVLLAGGYFLYSMLTAKPAPPSTVAIPSVVGMNETEASNALWGAKLKPVSEKVYDDTVKVGYAVGTDPTTGASVPEGSEVHLKISKGPASIVIPATLSGMTESAARDQLRALQLNAGMTVLVDDPKIPAGQVVSTSPAFGEKVAAGSIVNLNVSTGKVKLPALFGKTKDEAAQAIADLSPTLKVDFRTEENSQVSPGKVVGQDPGADSEVAQGSTIVVKIAAAPSSSPSSSPSGTACPTGSSAPPTGCRTGP
ncbi:Stk1 family PASTA domain-containing Ser/Thr kinase [Psychromicrobium xiongbiense]|uniref:Stk1 family PASTA domain-containing Ser/Thr kinase n=1 Tax=Psychromicrobium xiongbiense TaxID=3051184 RepID=UPI002553A271|nr:Stk1 family PASTA domain-containing Ser/Thr kinase [Psychromicrobium sp. YIM S02556]